MPRPSAVPTLPHVPVEPDLPEIVIDHDIPGQGRLFDTTDVMPRTLVPPARPSSAQARRLRDARRAARIGSHELTERTGLTLAQWWNAALGVTTLDDETERRVIDSMFRVGSPTPRT